MLSIIFALMSFKNQEERGSLLQSLLIFYIFMGSFAGYYAAQTYKMFKGEYWFRCAFFTATAYPSIVSGIFFELNICLAI